MRRVDRLRWISVVMVAALIAAACSGPPADDIPDLGVAPDEATVDDGATDGDNSNSSGKSSGKKKSGGSSGSTSGSAGTTTTTTGTGSGAIASAGGGTTSEAKQKKRAKRIEKKLPSVSLFSPQEDKIGISKDQITLCGHAALTFAEAFDTRIQDINVYWNWVNANGGIYGRKVVMSIEDDAYRADEAVAAAERCNSKDPFMLLGGIGFDQIPAVRTWAENNHMLYIHHIARQDLSKKFSFSYLPTVEFMGQLAARWTLKKHRNKKIGIIWRQSENWEPGHKTYLSTIKAGGIKPVADLPVPQNQALYTQQIRELQDKGAEVVFVWENALAAIELIKQAKGQGYNPIWLQFPFQLTTDTLEDDALNPKMEGIAAWPAYYPGETSGPFARYADEIKRFEQTHAQYGQAARTNDILWQVWLSWKQIHQLLLDCGPNCGRNKVVALLISGVHKTIQPGCPFDFTRNQHVGGYLGTIFDTYRARDGSAAWREVTYCKSSF